MLITMPNLRQLSVIAISLVSFALLFGALPNLFHEDEKSKPPQAPQRPPGPRYKPTPTWTPPPVKNNFPSLATSTPPPIPKWNVARKDVHKEYDLDVAPPLLIGFTRSWPILLQAVVAYITAGWPADQIYVVENTGVQQANARGQLSLQNQFHLNHTTLKTLGVNVVTTPTLLSFAQLQNFYLSLTYAHGWPYYFWSHMDVLPMSFEDGFAGKTPKYSDAGYKSIYTLALEALRDARANSPRWAIRFFAYDHLALVNPAAFEDVGGWDTLIPYYITDCDMHSRLGMRNWTMADAKAGIITDVSVALDDLLVLYRVDDIEPSFSDPNPPPPKPPKPEEGDDKEKPAKDKRAAAEDELAVPLPGRRRSVLSRRDGDDDKKQDENYRRWRHIVTTADEMYMYKHGERGRNTWQSGQRGGHGEPFYYDAAGLADAIELLTETGREVFRRKWGHRDCDLASGAKLKFDDQWRVEKDWE
ncbi:hypothetical protein B0T26DRAFT_649541 [Lasiosphaeria miniovina]|uniref:Glycosyl transferase family 8 protein n=1 Tax=Lasiosphaeria miniovina TaxID=1954250 RepID=A0AA40DUU4_9PEZI|nr:uncharacterized protein B0T26DRAFT_649541 [Lasiosphaeria miniovina]KAK0714021.1 hypothetical protein B0T26DRAFT_649541 [Lasiosphaeria miniovina]